MKKLYALYKPFNTMSQFTKECAHHVTLADIDFTFPKEVYPIGRLDADSEGLLLLTNDTTLNAAMLHPKNKQPKTYWVQVEGAMTAQALQQLEAGVTINANGKAHHTAPAVASIVTSVDMLPERHPPIRYRKDDVTTWLSITITEGKNRQVRKMCAAVGFPVLRLVRVSIGKLSILKGQYQLLEPGKVIELPIGYFKCFSEENSENAKKGNRINTENKGRLRKRNE